MMPTRFRGKILLSTSHWFYMSSIHVYNFLKIKPCYIHSYINKCIIFKLYCIRVLNNTGMFGFLHRWSSCLCFMLQGNDRVVKRPLKKPVDQTPVTQVWVVAPVLKMHQSCAGAQQLLFPAHDLPNQPQSHVSKRGICEASFSQASAFPLTPSGWIISIFLTL